jgi:hypothetical protein
MTAVRANMSMCGVKESARCNKVQITSEIGVRDEYGKVQYMHELRLPLSLWE